VAAPDPPVKVEKLSSNSGQEISKFLLFALDTFRTIYYNVEKFFRLMEESGEPTFGGREVRQTVEILLGAMRSQARDNVRVDLPLPRGVGNSVG
jgi:hypothetical protein